MNASGHDVDPGSPALLRSAMLMVVIGMSVFIVQPGFVQGLVEYAGFDDRQAGYIASAEMFGIALTTIIMTVLAAKMSWRRIACAALLVVCGANIVSIFTPTFDTFALLRFIVGMGSGALISIGYAVVGLTADPERNFGFTIVFVLTYSALVLLGMPLAYEFVGMPGLLVFFALLAACGLPLVSFLPVSGDSNTAQVVPVVMLPTGYCLLALLAVLSYFLAQGVVWSYLFLIGTAGGGSAQAIASALTLSQFLGIAGAFTVALLSARLNRVFMLTLGTLGGVVPLLFLFGTMGALVYTIAVGVFNYAANVMTPLLLAIIAGFDRSGRLVVFAVALQMLGLAIGPALAAMLISPGNYSNINFLSIALFLACLAFVLPPVLRKAPALDARANATLP